MGSGSAADTARVDFNTNVYQTLANKCGGCHSTTSMVSGAPHFVDTTLPSQDDHKAWMTVNGQSLVVGTWTTTAQVLTLPESGHQGTSYTTQEKSDITNWLNLEYQWRNASPGNQPVDLMAQWSGCLSQTDFDSANMSQAWANQVQSNEGVCKYCHVNGTSNFMATVQSPYMFTTITTDRAYLATFFTIDTTVTPNKIVVNQTPFMTAASGLTASGQHPRGWGDGTNNNGMTALQQLYTLATAKLSGGTCAPSTLTN